MPRLPHFIQGVRSPPIFQDPLFISAAFCVTLWDMFGLGLPEIIIILIVALLVVGPTKLPELARSLGRAFNDFRRMADDVKDTFNEEVVKEVEDIKKIDVMGETDHAATEDKTRTPSQEAAAPDVPQEEKTPPPSQAKDDSTQKQDQTNETKAT